LRLAVIQSYSQTPAQPDWQAAKEDNLSALADKRILVTGATGFIGSYLAERLESQGAHVLALQHTPGKGAALAQRGIEVLEGDITDYERMHAIISQDVQIVMHIAAWLRGKPYINYRRINTEATRNLAQMSAELGVEHFVFTSSIAVYGTHGDADVDEETPLKAYGDPYGDSKITCEEILQEVSLTGRLPITIVRPGMVYGPRSAGWTVRMIRLAKRGLLPLVDNGRGTAYPIYVDNLIDLLVSCTATPIAVGQVFNGVDDGPVSFEQFLGAYMRMADMTRALRAPGWLVSAGAAVLDPFVPGWSLTYFASQLRGRGKVLNDKAKQVLGWSSRISFDEGMKRCQAWLTEEGFLP
jgi:nucleoside-diphosphate-sugar epimerase